MRSDLLDILVCPLCKSTLSLATEEGDAEQVTTGTLTCTSCGERYPITDGIPNLLPPDLRDP